MITAVIFVNNYRVQVIIGPQVSDNYHDYSSGLQSLLNRQHDRRISGIIYLFTAKNGNHHAPVSLFAKTIRSISALCSSYFTEGMMVKVAIGKSPNLDGTFADAHLGITEATTPRTATKMRCFAVVREILRQQSLPVGRNLRYGTSKYLAEFSMGGTTCDLSIDLTPGSDW